MNTKQHITSLKNSLPNINAILEVQCGGGYDIENCLALQDKNLFYIGVDVVDEHILDNRQYFRDEKNKIFMILDASNEPLPKTDLVVATGMAPYLPIPNIWSLLENIRDSEARYFAFDYYHTKEELNADIEISDESDDEKKKKSKDEKPKKRPINLSEAPFYFPKPKFLFPTDDVEKSVALYEIKDVSYFMDWHNEDVSKLRADLFAKMEEDLKELKKPFLLEIDGEEMFREMMVGFLDVKAEDHNQKYYYDEPYKSIIDKADNGLLRRNNFFRLVHRCEEKEIAKQYEFINEDNFIHAQILAKDYIRFKFGLSLWID